MNPSYIYKIANRINGKVYIGQSILPERRWQQHIRSAFNPMHHDYHLPIHTAIKKYGVENFSFEVIETCEIENANDREIFWIAFYDSTDNSKGYNITLGGAGTSYYDMEQILDLWEAGKGVKEISEELNIDRGFLAMRLKQSGIPESEINKRRYESAKEARSFPVYQYSLEGELKCEYDSVQQAREITNIGHIEKCCNGSQKQAGGYIWSYFKSDRIAAVKNDHPATKKRPVYQYDFNGNQIGSYPSAYHAMKATGIQQDAIRNNCKNRSHSAGNYIWSFENRDKIDVTLSNNTGKAKKVAKYDMNSGKLIQIYDSLASAARENNIKSVGNITAACTGRYRNCAGFIWKYVD